LQQRVQITSDLDEGISVSCEEVLKRGNYTRKGDPNFSIAHLRVVYKVRKLNTSIYFKYRGCFQDYNFQELVLNLLYSTTNVFCYAIDEKATYIFKQQMQNLSDCFPNVYITNASYSIDSAGHNMDRAFLSCMYLLRNVSVWRYAITMQNYDIPIKTDAEMQLIVNMLNGSNSVGIYNPMPDRVPRFKNWTVAALKLFKNDSQNDQRKIKICKGNIGSVYSREFIEFLVDKMNPTIFLNRLDTVSYGNDEMFFPTLNANHILGMPGGFTTRCIASDANDGFRLISWEMRKHQCESGIYRHRICIYGMLDLATLRRQKQLFANKMMPEHDYTAIACWAKYLAQKASVSGHQHSLNLDKYSNAPNVIFNQDRDYWLKNIKKSKCLGIN
uniref:Core-2/I-Branching enzyme n=1 Tax=Syphacia muris TaxID=451379 RepID=A0A0N5AWM9_9BILA